MRLRQKTYISWSRLIESIFVSVLLINYVTLTEVVVNNAYTSVGNKQKAISSSLYHLGIAISSTNNILAKVVGFILRVSIPGWYFIVNGLSYICPFSINPQLSVPLSVDKYVRFHVSRGGGNLPLAVSYFVVAFLAIPYSTYIQLFNDLLIMPLDTPMEFIRGAVFKIILVVYTHLKDEIRTALNHLNLTGILKRMSNEISEFLNSVINILGYKTIYDLLGNILGSSIKEVLVKSWDLTNLVVKLSLKTLKKIIVLATGINIENLDQIVSTVFNFIKWLDGLFLAIVTPIKDKLYSLLWSIMANGLGYTTKLPLKATKAVYRLKTLASTNFVDLTICIVYLLLQYPYLIHEIECIFRPDSKIGVTSYAKFFNIAKGFKINMLKNITIFANGNNSQNNLITVNPASLSSNDIAICKEISNAVHLLKYPYVLGSYLNPIYINALQDMLFNYGVENFFRSIYVPVNGGINFTESFSNMLIYQWIWLPMGIDNSLSIEESNNYLNEIVYDTLILKRGGARATAVFTNAEAQKIAQHVSLDVIGQTSSMHPKHSTFNEHYSSSKFINLAIFLDEDVPVMPLIAGVAGHILLTTSKVQRGSSVLPGSSKFTKYITNVGYTTDDSDGVLKYARISRDKYATAKTDSKGELFKPFISSVSSSRINRDMPRSSLIELNYLSFITAIIANIHHTDYKHAIDLATKEFASIFSARSNFIDYGTNTFLELNLIPSDTLNENTLWDKIYKGYIIYLQYCVGTKKWVHINPDFKHIDPWGNGFYKPNEYTLVSGNIPALPPYVYLTIFRLYSLDRIHELEQLIYYFVKVPNSVLDNYIYLLNLYIHGRYLRRNMGVDIIIERGLSSILEDNMRHLCLVECNNLQQSLELLVNSQLYHGQFLEPPESDVGVPVYSRITRLAQLSVKLQLKRYTRAALSNSYEILYNYMKDVTKNCENSIGQIIINLSYIFKTVNIILSVLHDIPYIGPILDMLTFITGFSVPRTLIDAYTFMGLALRVNVPIDPDQARSKYIKAAFIAPNKPILAFAKMENPDVRYINYGLSTFTTGYSQSGHSMADGGQFYNLNSIDIFDNLTDFDLFNISTFNMFTNGFEKAKLNMINEINLGICPNISTTAHTTLNFNKNIYRFVSLNQLWFKKTFMPILICSIELFEKLCKPLSESIPLTLHLISLIKALNILSIGPNIFYGLNRMFGNKTTLNGPIYYYIHFLDFILALGVYNWLSLQPIGPYFNNQDLGFINDTIYWVIENILGSSALRILCMMGASHISTIVATVGGSILTSAPTIIIKNVLGTGFLGIQILGALNDSFSRVILSTIGLVGGFSLFKNFIISYLDAFINQNNTKNAPSVSVLSANGFIMLVSKLISKYLKVLRFILVNFLYLFSSIGYVQYIIDFIEELTFEDAISDFVESIKYVFDKIIKFFEDLFSARFLRVFYTLKDMLYNVLYRIKRDLIISPFFAIIWDIMFYEPYSTFFDKDTGLFKNVSRFFSKPSISNWLSIIFTSIVNILSWFNYATVNSSYRYESEIECNILRPQEYIVKVGTNTQTGLYNYDRVMICNVSVMFKPEAPLTSSKEKRINTLVRSLLQNKDVDTIKKILNEYNFEHIVKTAYDQMKSEDKIKFVETFITYILGLQNYSIKYSSLIMYLFNEYIKVSLSNLKDKRIREMGVNYNEKDPRSVNSLNQYIIYHKQEVVNKLTNVIKRGVIQANKNHINIKPKYVQLVTAMYATLLVALPGLAYSEDSQYSNFNKKSYQIIHIQLNTTTPIKIISNPITQQSLIIINSKEDTYWVNRLYGVNVQNTYLQTGTFPCEGLDFENYLVLPTQKTQSAFIKSLKESSSMSIRDYLILDRLEKNYVVAKIITQSVVESVVNNIAEFEEFLDQFETLQSIYIEFSNDPEFFVDYYDQMNTKLYEFKQDILKEVTKLRDYLANKDVSFSMCEYYKQINKFNENVFKKFMDIDKVIEHFVNTIIQKQLYSELCIYANSIGISPIYVWVFYYFRLSFEFSWDLYNIILCMNRDIDPFYVEGMLSYTYCRIFDNIENIFKKRLILGYKTDICSFEGNMSSLMQGSNLGQLIQSTKLDLENEIEIYISGLL